MSTGIASCVGHAPIVTVGPAKLTEQQKYERMWKHPQYRAVAPGEIVAQTFLAQARPKSGSTVIDFGAGTGRGALSLAFFGGLKVEMLDFAENCLDEDIRPMLETQAHALRFTQHDLTKPVPMSAQYGYCTDVLEHIPPEQVDQVLVNILQAAEHVFFQISCEDDVCGALIGQPLHLSVHDHAWWLAKLQALDCVVHWSQDCGTHCLFYVTAWQKAESFVEHGVLNVEEKQILENMRANLAADWNDVTPHEQNEFEVIILAGGPSLNDHVDQIKRLREAGAKLVTVNGTYHWALEHGLQPSAQIIVDARPHNARFTRPVVDNCRYLIASQVDPVVLEGLPKDRTFLWHTTMEAARELMGEKRKVWYGVPGGSSVVLRSLPLLLMLGYHKFHMFGFDSCLRDGAHHAYAQAENDGQMVIPVTCGDRIFYCHPWMCSQAHEFQDLMRFIGSEVDIEVYGDGLIANIINTGAALTDERELIEAAERERELGGRPDY